MFSVKEVIHVFAVLELYVFVNHFNETCVVLCNIPVNLSHKSEGFVTFFLQQLTDNKILVLEPFV